MTQEELNELASDCRLAFGHQAGAYNDGVDAMLRAVSIAQAQAAVEPVEANNDEVICPQCCNQFRAIPVNVQEEISALHAEIDDCHKRMLPAVDPVNEWTVIAPDGTRFTGPTPLKAAFPASKYRLEIDPVAAAKFAEVIEQIREEGEREHDECMEKFGTLDCPHCGGSGHIGDVQAADDKIKALAAGVKPFAYEIHAAMCEPELSYTKGGIKSLMQPLYTATAIAAARVQMGIECAKFIEGEEDGLPLETLANGIRALIGAKT